MKKKIKKNGDIEQPPRRIGLPGFVTGSDIGFGDVIKRTTSYFGILPCRSCEHRATTLNRWLVFTNGRPR